MIHLTERSCDTGRPHLGNSKLGTENQSHPHDEVNVNIYKRPLRVGRVRGGWMGVGVVERGSDLIVCCRSRTRTQ